MPVEQATNRRSSRAIFRCDEFDDEFLAQKGRRLEEPQLE